jgi:hypothetical protein
MARRRRVTAAIVGAAVATGLWLGAPLITSAVALSVSAEEDGGGDDGGGGDPAPAEPAAPEPAPTKSTPESAESPEEPDEPAETSPPGGATDSLDGDAESETLGPDDPANEEALDEEALDEEALDEEALDEKALDRGELTEEEQVLDEPDTEGAALTLDIAQGDGVEVSARGGGLLPESRAELWVFSTPQLLAQGTVDANGEIALSATLPEGLAEGSHTVVMKATDSSGQPVEYGSSVEIGPNGELLGVTPDADLSGLVIPELPDNPKAPQYPKVEALDQPAAVVSATIAAIALLSVTGAGLAGAARPGSLTGGGIDESIGGAGALLDTLDVEHNRGWRTRFTALGQAVGDRSWLHRFPFTSFVDEASYRWPDAVSTKSPLLARILGDAAPLRAIFGSLSLLLPIAALVLGVVSVVTTGGIAQPPVLGLLIALIIIGVLDAFAGLIGALAFTLVVVAMGGIIDLSSVRTLMGVALLIIGPGLIATSFREIRRAAPHNFAQWWERGADIVIVPLLGAYTTYNVASSLPPLGGSLFPVAESSGQLALIVAIMLIIKVLIEEAATRWFPERFATVVGSLDEPGPIQQALSALLKLAVFMFISAAFIGTSWQLWVGALVWFLPTVLAFLSWKLPNSSRLWQSIPSAMPLLAFNLFIFLIVAAAAGAALGDTPDFALTSFVIMLIPGLILGFLCMFGREPAEGDVRWYLRPSMATVYRVGGVVVLIAAVWLASDSIF